MALKIPTDFPIDPMIGQPLLRYTSAVQELPLLSEREHRIVDVDPATAVQAIYLKAAGALAKDAQVTIDPVAGTATSGGTDAKAAADFQANEFGWFILP